MVSRLAAGLDMATGQHCGQRNRRPQFSLVRRTGDHGLLGPTATIDAPPDAALGQSQHHDQDHDGDQATDERVDIDREHLDEEHTHIPMRFRWAHHWLCNPGSITNGRCSLGPTCAVLVLPEMTLEVYSMQSGDRLELDD